MVKGVIGSRISSKLQEDGYSLGAQTHDGRQYCRKHGIPVFKEFSFQETASKPAERKLFQQMLSLLWTDPANFKLIIEKQDRLFRNFQDREAIKALVMAGLEVHFFKTGQILNKRSDPSEWLVDGIMTSVNEYHVANLARESLKGMLEKARQGWSPSRAWFCYYNYIPPERRDRKRRRGGEIRLHEWGANRLSTDVRIAYDDTGANAA